MLEELRKKPKSIRHLYAFWGAALITLIIGGIWSVGMVTKIPNDASLPIEETKKASGAFSRFFGEAKQRLMGKEEELRDEPKKNNATSTLFGTQNYSTSATISVTGPSIIIATSSPNRVQIGTSTRVAE